MEDSGLSRFKFDPIYVLKGRRFEVVAGVAPVAFRIALYLR